MMSKKSGAGTAGKKGNEDDQDAPLQAVVSVLSKVLALFKCSADLYRYTGFGGFFSEQIHATHA